MKGPKQILEKAISDTEKIGLKEDVLDKEMNSLKRRLESDTFNLAVLGQFKRGKTSLVNALIGMELLPTAVIPLTSIITVLKYSKSSTGKAVFSDREEKIEVRHLEKYVTEKGNPHNEKGVVLVEIGYPSDYLKEGVVIIDTPGIGSTFLHNTEVTYKYLKNIDAGIFMLSADPPVSQSEIQFLQEARKHVKKLFFVLNKTDYLSQEQTKEALSFNKEVLGSVEKGCEIYPVSAKLALEAKVGNNKTLMEKSGFNEFEKTLSDFFVTSKESVFLQSIKSKILNILGSMEEYLDLEEKSMQMPINQLESSLKEFESLAESISREQEEAAPLMRSGIEKIMRDVDEDLEEFKNKQEGILLKKLESRLDKTESKGRQELLNELAEFLSKTIEEAFEPIRVKEEEKTRQGFESMAERFSRNADSQIGRISELASSLFGIKISRLPTEDKFVMDTDFYYKIEPLMCSFGDEINFLLPKFMFRKVLWKRLKGEMKHNLDMNCGRIRSDLLSRLNESSIKFQGALDENIEMNTKFLKSAIMKGMQKRNADRKKISGSLAAIRESRKRLAEIRNGLSGSK